MTTTMRAGHYKPTFDIKLTPKQRQVIQYIERGKTNYEIAQELGVSLEGAKYHVSEILAKLQVDSREEAVRVWKDYNSTGARMRRAFAGVGALPVLRIALVAAAVVPVVAIAIAIAVARSGSGGDDSAVPATGSTPTATVTQGSTAAAATPTDAAPAAPVPPTQGTPVAPTPTTTATSQQTQTTALRAYFMRGEAVGPVVREVPQTQAVARAALEQLLAGPSSSEASSGLTSAVPAGTRLLDISIADGIATVDLSAEFESAGGSLSMRARLAQLVYTLTQFPTVTGVQFRVEGQDTSTFGGEGVTIPVPATREEFEDLTPAILLDSPAQGDTVSSPVRLRGTANTFEATFRITILDGAGNVLAEEFATATSGTGTRGTFDVSVSFPVSAPGPGIIRVFESSPRDGSPTNVVDVPLQFEP